MHTHTVLLTLVFSCSGAGKDSGAVVLAPGCIDNGDILRYSPDQDQPPLIANNTTTSSPAPASAPSPASASASASSVVSDELKPDLSSGEDYFVVPEGVWMSLVNWYGVLGPSISRTVIIQVGMCMCMCM